MSAHSPSPAEGAGLPVPRRYFAGAAIVLAIILSVLDSTMVSVALPAMARDLGIASDASVWIITAYQIAIVAALLPMTRVAEIVGFRPVMITGLILFLAASVVCAVSETLWLLVAARVFQGLGAAAVLGMGGAFLRLVYPRSTLGGAVGFNAMIVGVTSAAGPALGSFILSFAAWPWLFLINIPVGLLAVTVATFALPDHRRPGQRLDAPAMALNAVTWVLLVIGLKQVSAAPVLGLAAVAVAVPAATVLVRRSFREPRPLFPVDLLASATFRSAAAASSFFFAAQMATFVALPFLLHDVHQMSYRQIGPIAMAWPLAAAAVSLVAGALSDRFSPTVLCIVGSATIATCLGLLTLPPGIIAGPSIAVLAGLCGLGAGLFQSPNNRVMISEAPHARGVSEAGIRAMAREVGVAVGTALVAIGLHASAAEGPRIGLAVAATLSAIACAIMLRRLAGIRRGRRDGA